MLIKLAKDVTKILFKYGSTIFTPPWAGDRNKTLQPSRVGSKSTQGIYVAPLVTELKSLNDVESAQRNGAMTNIDHNVTAVYLSVT
jgi:hypothetical protein